MPSQKNYQSDPISPGSIVFLFLAFFIISFLIASATEGFATKYDFPRTDTNYRYGPLPRGYYGDVPVYFYRKGDDRYSPAWRKAFGGGLYVHDTNTYRQDAMRLPTFRGQIY
jgi:hypothetical protein